jgi:hypothetical protein
MKTYFFIGLFLIGTMLICNAQILDVAPSGRQNTRAVLGGGERVAIDSKTSLNDLIQRLEKPWQFVETGKMYWIGYTDDMYSIAAHKDSAIKSLMEFIDTSHNEHAQFGAIYTLHLIGINSQVIGRFTEGFTNRNARKALLSLLKNDDFGQTIMELLVRDPWQSDVPELFSIIKDSKTSCWYIINGLMHYGLTDISLNQDIPEEIGNIRFTFPYSDVTTLVPDFDLEGQIQEILHSIKSLNNPHIVVDNNLFGKELWGSMRYKIGGDSVNHKWGTTVSNFLRQFAENNSPMSLLTGYGDVGNKLQYYIEDDRLTICSPETAKTRVVKWWNEKPQAYKSQFNLDNSKPFR